MVSFLHFNTTLVNVNLLDYVITQRILLNFNTTLVNVNPNLICYLMLIMFDFNTTLVNVNQLKGSCDIFKDVFQYNSC